ncbi:MAG: orotate phosphoribosyltransferase [Saccharofermentans sp.]|nr:orotate phosphoribosyltransferase [Saccharofermentans sp.]
MANTVSNDLFKTNAVRVAPADTPFWYTSGKLGPFYINTHFLVKSEEEANRMLKVIEDAIASDKMTAPAVIFGEFKKLYETSETFKNVTDALVEAAKKYDFDFISGGERRDFFFSMMPAYILKKPHLLICKDLSAVYTDENFENAVVASEAPIKGKKALHIADLITEASSYERAWVPALRDLGADITDTIAVVDRHQNGRAVLTGLGVNMETLTGINKDLFDEALSLGAINQEQYDLVMKFLTSPDDYMTDFLKANPTFIQDQINLGGKAEQRARLAVEKGFATL